MHFAVRPAHLPADYPAIAAVLHAEWSGADTAEDLAYADAHREPQYHHATFVAEALRGTEPLLVGVAFVGHDTLAHRAGKFAMNLRVNPDWQGQGAGKALYLLSSFGGVGAVLTRMLTTGDVPVALTAAGHAADSRLVRVAEETTRARDELRRRPDADRELLLADGDRLRLGSVLLTYRSISGATTHPLPEERQS